MFVEPVTHTPHSAWPIKVPLPPFFSVPFNLLILRVADFPRGAAACRRRDQVITAPIRTDGSVALKGAQAALWPSLNLGMRFVKQIWRATQPL